MFARCLAAWTAFFFALVLGRSWAAPPTPQAPEPPGASGVWLGVLLGEATDGGLEIVAVVPEGPADRAGVREGDVLLTVDEASIADRESLRRALEPLKEGREVHLKLLRKGQPLVLAMRVAGRVAPPAWPLVEEGIFVSPFGESIGRATAGGVAGLRVEAMPVDLRSYFSAPADAGVLVTGVEPGSSASKAGIRAGDVLVKIGRRPISDPGELKLALLEGDRPKTLELVRDKKPMTVQLVVSRPVAPRARAPVEALRLELQTMRAEFLERLAAIEAEIEKLRVDEERAN